MSIKECCTWAKISWQRLAEVKTHGFEKEKSKGWQNLDTSPNSFNIIDTEEDFSITDTVEVTLVHDDEKLNYDVFEDEFKFDMI